MGNFKLKFILSLLAGVAFSLVFILLAFVLPLERGKTFKKPQNKLEEVSRSLNK